MNTGKSNFWKCAAALMVAGMMAAPGVASAATVDEIVDRYMDAVGGQAANAAVKSATINADANLAAMGLDMTLVIHYKDGNFKQIVEIPGMGEMQTGMTGDVAWQVNPMEGDKVMEGQEAEAVREQAVFNPLLNWKARFASAKVAGEEGGETNVVFTSKSGRESTYSFDNATGLITKQSGEDASGAVATTYTSDYKKVGDIKIAHTMSIETDQATIDITFSSVELNPEIGDDTFALPEVIQAMVPAEGVTAEQVMAMMDANKDGKITMEEAPEQLQQFFTMVDANADEGIDVTEAATIAEFMNSNQ